jgi:hypothetical protein
VVAADGHAAVDIETGVVLLSRMEGRVVSPAARTATDAVPLFSVKSWFTLEAGPKR